jgi:hypothetical protein
MRILFDQGTPHHCAKRYPVTTSLLPTKWAGRSSRTGIYSRKQKRRSTSETSVGTVP